MAVSYQNKERVPQIGDVYLMKFGGNDGTGSEQRGLRPGLVFQNNVGNAHSPNIVILPMTCHLKKANQPTHVVVSASDTGLAMDSMVLCENPECASKERLGRYLTTLPDKYMKQVAEAYLLTSSVISFLDVETLLAVWSKASKLNAYKCAGRACHV